MARKNRKVFKGRGQQRKPVIVREMKKADRARYTAEREVAKEKEKAYSVKMDTKEEERTSIDWLGRQRMCSRLMWLRIQGVQNY